MATINISGGGSALNYAAQTATRNDVLLVEDGIYDPVTLPFVSLCGVTIRSVHGPKNCIIDATDTGKRCITAVGSGNYWSGQHGYLYGFTLRGGHTESGDGQYQEGRGGGAYGLQRMEDCIIENCTSANGGGAFLVNSCIMQNCIIRDCTSTGNGGAWLQQGDACKVTNCLIQRCDASGWGGVNLSAAYIDGCTFEDCGGGVSCMLHGNATSGRVVRRCVFKNCHNTRGTTGLIGDVNLDSCLFLDCTNTKTDCLVYGGQCTNCTFINCTSTNLNHLISIKRSYCTYGNHICNNIIGRGGIYLTGLGTTAAVIAGNIMSGTVNVNSNTTAADVQDNNIQNYAGDLGFRSESNDDYHLTAHSVAKGGGISDYVQFGQDLSSISWNSPPSVGCYEYNEFLTTSCTPLDGILPVGSVGYVHQ